MRDLSVTGLAAENIAKSADFSVDVLTASRPLLKADMAALIGRYDWVQIVSDKSGGLFLIGWDGTNHDTYSLSISNRPVKL